MNDTFMKEKPIFPLLTSMALPMVVSTLVNALYNIVDSLFVARISEEAMTALSLVYPVQNLINAIAIGFSIGIAALISLHLGAGNKEKADMAATHGMVLSLIHGVVISIVCTAIMPRFLRSFTSDETVIAMGVTYSRVAFMFAVVIMAAMAFEKIFQAVGRMNITMIGLMGGSVCNIILDPLLIFGIGPFPKMGIAGAALATGIGQMVPVIFYLIVYFVSPIPVRLRSGCLKPDAKMALQLYSIGVPAILNLALPSVLITFLNSLLPSTLKAMLSCWVSTINYRPSCTCPPTALCRVCAPSSATTTAQGSMTASKSSTAHPWACAPPSWPRARCSVWRCPAS